MTDLTPNDLSHLSDAEFHALCPQGEHAPGPEPLSPAAQAIVAAFNPPEGNWEETCLVAALRARADHIRADILAIAIATDLETTDD